MLRKFFSFFIGLVFIGSSVAQEGIQNLPSWQQGFLDIHFISTGRGNAIFSILPDGTTLLIDAGDLSPAHKRTLSERNCPACPNNSKTPPQWIVAYIKNIKPDISSTGIDYALITHYHDDHFGEADSLRKPSGNGYQLTGITEVGSLIKIHTLIDRGFTDPIDLFSSEFRNKNIDDEYHIVQTLDEYMKFITYQKQLNNLNHQVFKVGHANQIVLNKNPGLYPTFQVQNLFGAGKIWNGFGDSLFKVYPDNYYPGENPLSLGIKITYGKFNFYTGGDIAGNDALGQPDLNSMESHSAPIVGAVDVATMNHHGNRDSHSAYWVRTLRPRVWVEQNWSSDHPGEEVLRRVTSKKLYPGPRDLYATCMTDANRQVIGEAIDNSYVSTNGHIVVRVTGSGNSYSIYVLDDTSSRLTVKSIKHYQSQ